MVPRLRRFHHQDFCLDDLVAAKAGLRGPNAVADRFVSVCLPARDEAATIGPIVATIRRDLVDRAPLVDEILVVDDGSTDGTAAVAADAGATVVAAADVLPGCGPGQGKGEALWKALGAAKGDLLAFCDADIRDFDAAFVTGLLGPLLTAADVGFVKGFYERPLEGRVGEGGRVTELVARPLLALLFPHLASVAQPLAGEFAGRREVLEQVPFVQGYGVDLALLVDVAALIGVEVMVEVDLGTRTHRNRPLAELAPAAAAVLRTALDRGGVELGDEPRPLVRPGREPELIAAGERPPIVDEPEYRARR
jgi:glucosyl-3-phosphoglycerate synthase